MYQPALPRGKQLLAREFGRGAQVELLTRSRGRDEIRSEGVQMGFVSRRAGQNRCFDLNEIPRGEVLADGGHHSIARQQKRPAVGLGPQQGSHETFLT